MADYYELLGVPPTAPVEEVRAAYRKRAGLLHPDRHPGDSDAVKRFCEISNAYDILADPDQRRAYDASCRKKHPESLLDSLSADLESALTIFSQVVSLFDVPEPKKRSECATCNGSGETTLELGLLIITRSCPDCEAEKPSTVAGDRP
jgi:DnaJ-class molecular chaperone